MRTDPRVPLPNFGMQPILEPEQRPPSSLEGLPEIPAAVDVSQFGDLPAPEVLVPPIPQEAPGLEMAPGPRDPGGSGPEAREYVRVPVRQEAAPHPWKVTSEGASSVSIAAGKLRVRSLNYINIATDARILTTSAVDYAGETGFSAGEGYLYAQIGLGDYSVSQLEGTGDHDSVTTLYVASIGATVTMVYSEDELTPSTADDDTYNELVAILSVEDSRIVVDQVLYHNPMLDSAMRVVTSVSTP